MAGGKRDLYCFVVRTHQTSRASKTRRDRGVPEWVRSHSVTIETGLQLQRAHERAGRAANGGCSIGRAAGVALGVVSGQGRDYAPDADAAGALLAPLAATRPDSSILTPSFGVLMACSFVAQPPLTRGPAPIIRCDKLCRLGGGLESHTRSQKTPEMRGCSGSVCPSYFVRRRRSK